MQFSNNPLNWSALSQKKIAIWQSHGGSKWIKKNNIHREPIKLNRTLDQYKGGNIVVRLIIFIFCDFFFLFISFSSLAVLFVFVLIFQRDIVHFYILEYHGTTMTNTHCLMRERKSLNKIAMASSMLSSCVCVCVCAFSHSVGCCLLLSHKV